MRSVLVALALALGSLPPTHAQSPTGAVAQVDARAEVAAALFAASATLAAAERVADAKTRAQRTEIEGLRAKVRAGDVRLQTALTESEERYVTALAERDRAYAQEIAVFRAAVENIAKTPEGVAALARFNAGDERGAVTILQKLREARSAARTKRADIESAADGRLIATLALEARAKGKFTTAEVIGSYEEVTRLDPGVSSDWVQLRRLFQEAGRLPDALRAARAAADSAANDWDRALAFDAVGEVQVAQGDLPSALTSFRASLAIAERLANADPGNAVWQRGLSVTHLKSGDVQRVQGDLSAALTSYWASLAIAERLADADPGNAGWQRDLSVSYERIGDVRRAQGELSAALASYQDSLAIAERLAKSDPSNAEWQSDLSYSHNIIGDVQMPQGDLPAALTSYRASLAIWERLAKSDPGNAAWQRELSITYGKIGDVQREQGDLPAALTSYRACLAISERLAKVDPSNAVWQRDLVVSYVKLSGATGDKAYVARALSVALDMQRRGILAPRDAWMVEELKKRAASE